LGTIKEARFVGLALWVAAASASNFFASSSACSKHHRMSVCEAKAKGRGEPKVQDLLWGPEKPPTASHTEKKKKQEQSRSHKSAFSPQRLSSDKREGEDLSHEHRVCEAAIEDSGDLLLRQRRRGRGRRSGGAAGGGRFGFLCLQPTGHFASHLTQHLLTHICDHSMELQGMRERD
jgi:hypothetical protein